MSNTLGPDVVIKPMRTFLPLLTVLFLISYGLLTLLVVEQSRTIDAQRGLIRDLFQDSAQLTSIKAKAIQKQNVDAQAKARSQAKTPPAQSSPGTDNHNHRTSKLRRPLPQKPPKDTSGESDERRILIAI